MLLSSLIGQPQVVALLESAIAHQRIAPAYLFAGPAGVGRRLAAQGFTEILLAKDPRSPIPSVLRQRVADRNHPDLLWVEPTYLHQGKRLSAADADAQGLKRRAPPQIRLEQIRELAQFLSRPPLEADRAVVVIEDAETMAEPAANGLLKTLEEPGKATLILIAPGPEALLPTLVSRCQRIPFRRLSPADLATVLQRNGYEAILQYPEVLALAQGSPGEAIAHWQQLQTIPPELLQTLTHPPTSLKDALERGRAIADTLDTEAQLWLVDYLQHWYWQQRGDRHCLAALEKVRKQLLAYVQPRLVWEVVWMELGG